MALRSFRLLFPPLLLLLHLVSPVAGWSGSADKKVVSATKTTQTAKHLRVVDKGVQEQLDYVSKQLSAFLKTRNEFSRMHDQLNDRFKSDENEIDRLVDRQHQIKAAEANDIKTELDAIGKQASMLEAEEKIYADRNQVKQADSLKQQISGLQELRSTLSGSADELDADQKSVAKITQEGKTIYAEMQKIEGEQATIETQLQTLEKQQARLEDRVDGDGAEEEEGREAYEAESASALEKAVGWNQDKLEQQATDAEDALHKGIGGKDMVKSIDGMMGMMHAVR